MIPLFSGGPEEALELSTAHILQDDEHRLAFCTTTQKAHHVWVRIQVLHDPQFLRKVQSLSFGGVLLQGLHRDDRCTGLAVDVESLALPHLAEAALAEDVENLGIRERSIICLFRVNRNIFTR